MTPPLTHVLLAAVQHLPDDFRAAHARLFAPEHLATLAARLQRLHAGADSRLPPHMAGELTRPASEVWAPLRHCLGAHAATGEAVADALVAVGTAGLLVLLGQRVTAGSWTDSRAVPPTTAELLAAADDAHDGGALDKHARRATGGFWERPVGTTAEKNARARDVLQRLLDGRTWWNVFELGGRGVYEARVPTGHGARWELDGLAFLGLVEPFGKPPPADRAVAPARLESR